MTKTQRITLMADWWPRACQAQGWNPNDRAARLRVLSQAVGRELATASDLNNTSDVDKVKAHLAALADHLPPVLKHETPDEDAAVRWRWVVRKQIEELAQVLNPELETEHLKLETARAYARALIRDKFQHGAPHVAALPELTLDDLTLDQLRQLKITLTRATAQKRKAWQRDEAERMSAGILADTRGACANCEAQKEPALAHADDNEPF